MMRADGTRSSDREIHHRAPWIEASSSGTFQATRRSPDHATTVPKESRSEYNRRDRRKNQGRSALMRPSRAALDSAHPERWRRPSSTRECVVVVVREPGHDRRETRREERQGRLTVGSRPEAEPHGPPAALSQTRPAQRHVQIRRSPPRRSPRTAPIAAGIGQQAGQRPRQPRGLR